MEQKVGTRIGWGTGGDEGAAIKGIRDMALNPHTYNVLPYLNRYTPDSREIYSSMFIPSYVTVFHLIDSRG